MVLGAWDAQNPATMVDAVRPASLWQHLASGCLLLGACLPGSAATASSPPSAGASAAEDWAYPVERGDTLIGIAGRLLQSPLDWRALQRHNRVANPRRLQPGRVLRIPLAWLRPDAAAAEIVDVVGDTRLEQPGGPRVAVVSGQKMVAGDTLVTAADSSAVIRLADGSRVLVVPRSRITLARALTLRGVGAGMTSLQLQQGGVEAQVRRQPPRPRFEIQSPVLDLSARGTDFRARFDSDGQRAWGEVTEGRVAATPAGRAAAPAVLLESGHGILGASAGLGERTALLPAPDLASTATLVERLPVRLEWPPQPIAAGWRAQVLERGGATRLLFETRSERPQVQFGDLPDGDYLLRVRAIDGSGLEGSSRELGFKLKARPEPPFLREPNPDERRVGTSTRFVWALSSAARSYHLQVASDARFAQPLHDRPGLTGAELELPLPPGRWFWRLASVRGEADRGPWGDAQTFEVLAPPPTPVAPQSEPPRVDAGRIVLRWAAGRPGDGFEFQLARDPGFADRVLEQRSATPEVTLEGLDGGRYHVRSRVVGANGLASPWGAPSEFEVPASQRWWWLAPALLLIWLL